MTTFSGVLVRSGSLVLTVVVAEGAVLFVFSFCMSNIDSRITHRSCDKSHSCTFVTSEVKYRNRSGKLRQLFGILDLIFCLRENQNRLITDCQSTTTLFFCSEVDLKKQKNVTVNHRSELFQYSG